MIQKLIPSPQEGIGQSNIQIQRGKLVFFHIDACELGLSIAQEDSHLHSSPPNTFSEHEFVGWDVRSLFWADQFSCGQQCDISMTCDGVVA